MRQAALIRCRKCHCENETSNTYCTYCGHPIKEMPRAKTQRLRISPKKGILLAGTGAFILLFILSSISKWAPQEVAEGIGLDSKRRAENQPPEIRHEELKYLMLSLVNEARADSEIPTVKLGSNPAAQLHAEAALQGCYSAHWDRWGLKPNHRYTLTSGTGADGENASGIDYCIKPWDNYRLIGSMKTEVKETMEGLMDSPGHRDNILDPAHTELNLN